MLIRIRENFVKFVIFNPPWVIFMIAIGVMAIGVLGLALNLRKRNSDSASDARGLMLCYYNGKADSFNQSESEDHVFVPITSILSQQLFDNILLNPSENVLLSGVIYTGQLGLQGKLHNENWTFLLPLDRNLSACYEEDCSIIFLPTCLIVFGEKSLLPNIKDLGTCGGNITSLASKKDLKSTKVVNAKSLGSQEIQNNPTSCANRITINHNANNQFVMIPIARDTYVARMHLLATSYFLFTLLVLMLCVAAWKKTSSKLKETFVYTQFVDQTVSTEQQDHHHGK